jgi:pyruvate/2-oxoacid:ferredoxin oxidoreductase beta subunit
MMAKFKKAKEIKGFKFIHIFHHVQPVENTQAKVGVCYESRNRIKIFPLFEVVNGK